VNLGVAGSSPVGRPIFDGFKMPHECARLPRPALLRGVEPLGGEGAGYFQILRLKLSLRLSSHRRQSTKRKEHITTMPAVPVTIAFHE